jgi:dTDP-glucose 4,6-dehydratase
MKKKIIVTGGAGFIGSHLVNFLVKKYPNYHIYNLDKLTYAANLDNLKESDGKDNYTFIHGDICDKSKLEDFFEQINPDAVIHLAAESHVDNSIKNPLTFVLTNVIGTINLLEVCRTKWSNYNDKVFYHVSTDEVYGSLGKQGFFTEKTSYDPRSPYSASKASSDHFVRAYNHTYKLPVLLSNCSNNYGPNQFPEKLIPVIIKNVINKTPIPVYGKGENVRDWLWVHDHVAAIDNIFHNGTLGETYNIGGGNEWTNIELVEYICDVIDTKLGRSSGESRNLISFVEDRKGHDLRYAIDFTKLNEELKWEPSLSFDEGILKTVEWYLDNQNIFK